MTIVRKCPNGETMPIYFKCTCGKALQSPDGSSGSKVRCPQCSAVLQVPSAQPEAVAAPPAPQVNRPASIEIQRIKKQAVMFRNLAVIIDGEKVGTLKNGQSLSFEVNPGHHEVVVALDRAESEPLPMALGSGESSVLECEAFTGWTGPRIELRKGGMPSGKAERVTSADQQAAKITKPAIPPWAWIFAVLCGIIPIVTLGGAIPAAIGFGGASGSIAVARSDSMTTFPKIFTCSVITFCCWIYPIIILILAFS